MALSRLRSEVVGISIGCTRGLFVQDKRLSSQRPIGSGLENIDTFFCGLQLLITITIEIDSLFVEL